MNTEGENIDNSSFLIEQLRLPQSFTAVVDNIYRPLSKWIITRANTRSQTSPLLISINGAQGTGKSTMTCFLKNIIESKTGWKVVELSLDDFYLSRKKRAELAKNIHPLLKTRGVPGTHDLALMEHVFDKLINRHSCIIPKFDKAADDRCEANAWQSQTGAVDIILFEGWCNHSPAQTGKELRNAVNDLEEKEDAQGVWRNYVNEQLIDYQKRVFDLADKCIMLKAPDFESVYQWRSLQEQKLQASASDADKTCGMNENELKRFVQHFERISRHSLKCLPAIADVVLPVASDHLISGIIKRKG